jgi:metal-responsive CopG/Arc/MetJ family transcriptional regulator
MKSKKPAPAAHEPAVTVELPEEMLQELDRLAHQERITRSEVIRRLIKQALAAQPMKVANPTGRSPANLMSS